MKSTKSKSNFDVFSDEYLGKVRTMFDPNSGEIFFHAMDVANCLGYVNAASVISVRISAKDKLVLYRKDMPDDIKNILWNTTRGRGQVTFINEAAVYRLIMGAQTDVAERFKDWICNTVLISIRQNGGYIMGQEDISEDVSEEILALRAQVLQQANQLIKAKSDVDRLQKRRHELLDVVKKEKLEKKDLKKNLSYMVDDSNYWYRMYMNLMDDYEVLQCRLESLKAKTPQQNPQKEDDSAILPNGMVIKKSEWRSYREE